MSPWKVLWWLTVAASVPSCLGLFVDFAQTATTFMVAGRAGMASTLSVVAIVVLGVQVGLMALGRWLLCEVLDARADVKGIVGRTL